MADLPPTFELAEPPTAAPLLPHWSYASIGFAICGSLALCCAVILLIRRLRRARSRSPESARLRAWRAAEKAFAALPVENPREAAIGASFILRRYLADVSHDPALFETHEETLARGGALAFLPEEMKQRTAGVFARLAALKYSHDDGGDSPESIAVESRSLLKAIHHGIPA